MGWKSIVIPEGEVKQIATGGIVIWKKPSAYEDLEYIYFDGKGMVTLPLIMNGNDTIRAKFHMYSSSGNLFGYFNSSSADNNFCLYGSSSSYIRYDGNLVRNWDLRKATGVHDIVFSNTGLIDNGRSITTWAKKTFTGENPCVGGLPNSTTAKASWKCFEFSIDGKCNLLPKKRVTDKAVGLLDTLNDVFYTESFMHETAPTTLTFERPVPDDGEH